MTVGTVSAGAPAFATFDPRLPGRDILLDNDAMRQRLGHLLGVTGRVTVDDIRLVRAKYRPGESVRAVHRIQVRGQWYLVASRMRAEGGAALYREALAHAVAGEALRGVAFDGELQCVFWTFPNDRRLPVPGEPLARHPLMRLFATDRLDIDIAGYAPERAVVHRVTDGLSGRVLGFAKRFAPGGSHTARAILDALAAANERAAAPVLVPRVLGHDAAGELLVTDAVSGTHLNRLTDSSLEPAFVALGSAMARLHVLSMPAGLPVDDPYAAPAVAEAVSMLALARPDVAEPATRLAETLLACRPDDDAPVWIHGDLNSRNWLAHCVSDDRRATVAGGDVGLIDFDQSTAGPAGVDLGGVLAWMRTRTLLGEWTHARERTLEAALLRGYAGHRQTPSPAECHWYRAAALVVQRAVRAATRVRRRQLVIVPEMLAAAARDLEAMRHA